MIKFFINEKKLLEILKEMISINSVNPSLSKNGMGEEKIAYYIGKCLSEIGLKVEYQEIGQNRINVIGILRGYDNGKSLMLNGHMDTVGINDMKIEPFYPKYENGKVYGRGSIDMKSGLSAMLIAINTIINSGIKLKGNVILAFVADEEYMSKGTEALIKKYHTDAAIVCEPTNLEIGIAHKGFAWIKVEVFGKAAHGSQPLLGIDAIIKASKFLNEIENFAENVLSKKVHPLLGSPSIHASKIHGGTEISTYPNYCKIELERRTLPNEDEKTIEKEIKNLIEKISNKDKQFKAESEIFFSRSAFEIDKNELIINSLVRAYEKVLGRKPKFTGLSFWTDGSILKESNIPTVIFGPSGEGLHASIEFVDFKSIIYVAQILIETIIDFCNYN
jgi:acetylornithine deacetylase